MVPSDPSFRLAALCFDALDPAALARFWGDALGWRVLDGSADDVILTPTDGTRFDVVFVPVSTPKAGQNRNHLDVTTTSLEDQERMVAQLTELGGSAVDIGQGPEEPHVVLADPEGNELCIIEPGNNFLAGTGRLGAINCDGTRRVGVFWSEVLGWPLVWDQDEETAIRPPDGTGPLITWSGPPLMPKSGRNRLYLELAAESLDPAVARLLALGATLIDDSDGRGRLMLADPDGNEFRLTATR